MPSSYAVGPYFERFIKRQIKSERYSNASEVVRKALPLMDEREELREAQLQSLRTQIQKGIDSGSDIPEGSPFARYLIFHYSPPVPTSTDEPYAGNRLAVIDSIQWAIRTTSRCIQWECKCSSGDILRQAMVSSP